LQIENLAEDIDFRTTVTRQQLEDAIADMKPLLEQPVRDALEMAGIKAVSRLLVVL
jgi:molecular chaperone DnaK (HSP70)